MKKRLSASLAVLTIGLGIAVYAQMDAKTTPEQTHTVYPAAVHSEGEALGKQFTVPRRPQDVASFYMDTPEMAYHFIRTQQGDVQLDGRAADRQGFEGMLELLFDLPVKKDVSEQTRMEETMTLTLGYSDGTKNTMKIGFQAQDAWMHLEDGRRFYTDAWRIHALLIACDGARLEE